MNIIEPPDGGWGDHHSHRGGVNTFSVTSDDFALAGRGGLGPPVSGGKHPVHLLGGESISQVETGSSDHPKQGNARPPPISGDTVPPLCGPNCRGWHRGREFKHLKTMVRGKTPPLAGRHRVDSKFGGVAPPSLQFCPSTTG